MITGSILTFLTSIVSAILGTMPSIPVPAWLDTSGFVGTVFQYADSMSVWFPTTLVLGVLAAYFAIKLTGFGIKVLRIAASFLTGGGGSAA